ncbi:MAG: zinc-dependent metalloprotease [Gemmatimonadaceae bacterium]|nr:zinc-dependent metalloprotease [Gemmatimonadaceae bacterium]
MGASMRQAAILAAGASFAFAQQGQQQQRPAATIAERTAGFVKRDGFVPVYTNDRTSQVLFELRDSTEMLLLTTLPTGLGSNPVGLDRGSGGGAYVPLFHRFGDRMLVTFQNTAFRSTYGPDNLRTVREAFPNSTVFSLPILADEGGRLLVDATDLVYRDWNNIARSLGRGGQGTYTIARDRSRPYNPYTKGYADNTEIDIALTLVAQGAPGGIAGRMAPDGSALDFRQHISLVRLPDSNFRPREADPRVGYFGVRFKDYATPMQGQLEKAWAGRHRLERVNPNDPKSPIKNPIVYYVDRGIPEPLRTATLEGVRFWEEAFDQAGLKGGFKVELLPEGADPMDIRYNVVQWENRNERGWSVGGAITDPRTGEMLKGMARLDSHRNRTDYNLYAALMGADPTPADTSFVLKRIRQVSAHEVGHTLGLGHNYIASTYERGSVMDYPAPRVLVKDGAIDLSQAYARGPGAYDVWAIRWGYGIFPPATEADSLKAIVADGLKKGYLYLSDGDARPENAADPRTSLWDDAANPGEFFTRQMAARRIALDGFGLRNVRAGEPLSILQDRFPLLYYFHRFAINGVTKNLGGLEYANAVRGDGQTATRMIPPAQQRAAMAQLMSALDPKELAIPDTVLALFAPRLDATGNVELPGTRTYPAFDELGTARGLAQMVVDGILQRERAARMVQQTAHQTNSFTLTEAIRTLVNGTWNGPAQQGAKLGALQNVTQRAVSDRLILLTADSAASPEVRAIASFELTRLADAAAQKVAGAADDASKAHWQSIADDIRRYREKGVVPALSPVLYVPPGDPYGDDGWPELYFRVPR